jgi:hypothetical protein
MGPVRHKVVKCTIIDLPEIERRIVVLEGDIIHSWKIIEKTINI